jgi:hypothetical protein
MTNDKNVLKFPVAEVKEEEKKKYAFEGMIIRLIDRHYESFKKEFSNIDIDEELRQIDLELDLAKENGEDVSKWYWLVKGKLKYQNDKAKRFNSNYRGGSYGCRSGGRDKDSKSIPSYVRNPGDPSDI